MLFISIVIPAYNEQDRLPATLQKVLEYVGQRPERAWEIIVVNDGSTDGTASYVRDESTRHPMVRLIDHTKNCGKGYCVRTGMLSARGEWRLFTDADLSAPIEELEPMLDAVEKAQAAIAVGSRAVDRSLIDVHQSAFREYAGRIFNLFARVMTGLKIEDTQCGFKLYRADAADKVFSVQQLEGFGFDVEDLFIARLLKFKTIEVPVRWSNMEGSKVSLLRGLDSFVDVLRVRWFHLQGKYRS